MYKDLTFEEMPILALIDVIDWWEPHWNPGITESLINEDKMEVNINFLRPLNKTIPPRTMKGRVFPIK